MFSKDLSTSIIQLCSNCDLSPGYFGSIARGETDMSLCTIEMLCKGFELTPNEQSSTAVGFQNPYGFSLRTWLLPYMYILRASAQMEELLTSNYYLKKLSTPAP